MTPSVTIDNTPDLDDFAPPPAKAASTSAPAVANADAAGNAPPVRRTLLLAPPSLASNEPALAAILSQHDRSATDLQMLDRLSAGLVRLPESTYDLILVLASAEATAALLTRDVLAPVTEALRPGGYLRAHEARLDAVAAVAREAVLAGLVVEDAPTGGYTKPDYGDSGAVVSLVRLKKKKKGQPPPPQQQQQQQQQQKSSAGPAVPAATVTKPNGQPETVVLEPAKVVTLDLGDDLDGGDDDELIDEDTLLTEEDMNKTFSIPPECVPKVGKRRRACKDCTCGLAEKLAAEDADKKSAADAKLQTITLSTDDLAEVDFTVQGKVGSCGNCALGDAFRCDGCPYIGMPKFEWGQEVKLLNNEVQL
jgi:hypothetical protein